MSEKQAHNRRINPAIGSATRFPKGVSGNPRGRPKITVLSEAIKAQLAEALPGKSEATYAEMIAKALCKRALAGDVMAAKEIADRSEGKAKQALSIDLSVMDWREMARAEGLSENDVIREANLLIQESALDSSDAQSN